MKLASTHPVRSTSGLTYANTGLDHGEVVYVPGCACTNCSDAQSDFAPAVAAAKTAKLAVVVLGTLGWDRQNDGADPSPNAYEREGHDRTSIALAGNQYELAAELAASGTPVICVLMHGGSIELGSLLEDCTAIVDTWFPGQQGGAGFADLLFGKVSAGGRSPQTYYKDDAELPPLGNMDLYQGKGTTYRYYSGKPVIPFGFGLSFTAFSYSNLQLSASSIGHCDSVKVTVTVTNTGERDGDEVVQLYVKTPGASVKAPRIRLADFTRITIPTRGSAIVELEVSPKYHSVVMSEKSTSFWHPSIMIEAGRFELHVGGGQPELTAGTLSANVDVREAGALNTRYRC